MQKKKFTAIILSGGSGRRMKSSEKKQFMQLSGRPLIWYALEAFEESPVDEVILVTGREDIEYCKVNIVEKYKFRKVKDVIPGGAERFHSVYQGLLEAEGSDYVLIHDGARPFVTNDMIKRSMESVEKYGACAVAVPSKDTVKIADQQGFALETPDRRKVYLMQTPQTFSYPMIRKAYEEILQCETDGITDDAMVVEHGNFAKVKLVTGTYENIKITTPEDMEIAEIFCQKKERYNLE